MNLKNQHCVIKLKFHLIFWFGNYMEAHSFTTWKVSKYGVFSGPYFPVSGLNTEIYSVNLYIQYEYRKIRTRKYSVFGHFSRSVSAEFRRIHPEFCRNSAFPSVKTKFLHQKIRWSLGILCSPKSSFIDTQHHLY